MLISKTSARRNLANAYHSELNEDFEQFMWDHVDDVCLNDTEKCSLLAREMRMTMLMGGPL